MDFDKIMGQLAEYESQRIAQFSKSAAENPPFESPAMDAFMAYMVGKLPGVDYVRIAREHGKNHWLINPTPGGKDCFCNGKHPGIAGECDGCEHYSTCFPLSE